MALTKITSRILDSSGVTILGTIATGVWQGTPIADDHIASAATWNTASTDRLKWDGGATGLTASTGRTSLGLGTVATTAASDYATAAQGTKADTAHGWGNHTGGGYVKTTTDQTIEGVKTFSSAATFQLSALTNPSGVDANTVLTIKNNGWSGITMLSSAATGSFLTFGDADAGFRGRILYLQGSTDAMVFETAASEKMRISSGGKITTTSSDTTSMELISNQSASSLRLKNTGTTASDWYIQSGGGTTGQLNFYSNVSGSTGSRLAISSGGTVSIGSSTATNPLSIRTANGESYLRFLNADGTSYGDLERSITGNGAVRITTPYFRVTGTLETQGIQSALGIVFNNNSVAGNKTSVTLNAYEEGTWTPSPNFSTTNAFSSLTSSGTYTRIGRLVTATLIMSFEKGSSAGNFTITGLPFTVINTTVGSGRSGFSVSYLQRIGQADKIFTAYATENTTTIQPYFTGQLSSATVISVAATDISADTASVVGTITYQV